MHMSRVEGIPRAHRWHDAWPYACRSGQTRYGTLLTSGLPCVATARSLRLLQSSSKPDCPVLLVTLRKLKIATCTGGLGKLRLYACRGLSSAF